MASSCSRRSCSVVRSAGSSGAGPKEVSVRAGHTSVSFTLDRYGHLFPGHDAELRDRLDAMHAEGLQSQVT